MRAFNDVGIYFELFFFRVLVDFNLERTLKLKVSKYNYLSIGNFWRMMACQLIMIDSFVETLKIINDTLLDKQIKSINYIIFDKYKSLEIG